MKAPLPWRGAVAAGAVLLAAACVLPVAVLVPEALVNPGVAASALSARRVGLLVSSVRLATLVLLVDTLVAGAAALWAHVARRRTATVVLGVALAGAFVPPIAHAAAWAGAAEAVRNALGLAVTPLTGLPAAVLAQSTAYLPLATAVALAGMLAVDPGLVEAARVMAPDARALRRIVLPLAAPIVMAGGGIACLLSLGDEVVPAAFGVDTAAMELFASFAAEGSAGTTLALAWPLALVCGAAALACAAPLRAVSLRQSWRRRPWSVPPELGRGVKATLGAGAGLAASVSVAVVGALAAGSLPPGSAAAALAAAGPDIGTTVGVALAAGAVAFPLALLAGAPAGPGAPPSRLVWGFALLAAVVPAPVMGAGLVTLYNHDLTAGLFDSPAMLVLAGVARFAPLASVVVAVAASRVHRPPLEAALVSSGPGRAFARVLAPSLFAPAASGALLVAAFTAGELGATLMVVPPGTSTAVVRAFNLLHYGASGDVAAIALAVAAVGILAAAGAWAIGRRAFAP